MTEKEVATKARQRGYRIVRVRPAGFDGPRVNNVLALRKIIRERSVQFRGWDFPHIGKEEAAVLDGYIADNCDFMGHVEYWRLYQSGQFVFVGGLRYDWFEAEGAYWTQTPTGWPQWPEQPILGIGDTIYHFAELLEFAARLALSELGSEHWVVTAEYHRLDGRMLWMDDNRRFGGFERNICRVPSWKYEVTLAASELAEHGRRLGIEPVVQLFRQFGWDVTPGRIGELQDQWVKQ